MSSSLDRVLVVQDWCKFTTISLQELVVAQSITWPRWRCAITDLFFEDGSAFILGGKSEEAYECSFNSRTLLAVLKDICPSYQLPYRINLSAQW